MRKITGGFFDKMGKKIPKERSMNKQDALDVACGTKQ